MKLSAVSAGRLSLLFLFLAVMCLTSAQSHAQGCIAARSNQRMEGELCGDGSAGFSSGWLHRLTVNVGYRNFSSYKHFIGTDEQTQRAVLHNQIKNHQNIWDVGINYQLTPRWSLIADVPFLDGSRNQLYSPAGIYRVGGIGDMTVGAQSWIFRPPTESNGNVAFNFALKIPTGLNNAVGTATQNGQTIVATADQSMQPGDGGWGFVVGAQSYKEIWWRTMLYFQGSWLFNPENTNGVLTFRRRPQEAVMSVTDQYLFRGGFAHGVPKIRRLTLSLGGRMEGIPVRDAFGKSDGFRRPGYIISLDPGLMYSYKHEMISINGPWALERNRRASTTDIATGRHGDAAFADYTIIVGISHHF